MPFQIDQVTPEQVARILAAPETHFVDLKAIEVQAAKLSETISAFANADGGELFVGIDEVKPSKERRWRGFQDPEAANSHIQVLERLFPLGQDFQYSFLQAPGESGLILHIAVRKTQDIKRAADLRVYVRRGAQKLPLTADSDIRRLEYTKGISSFENELTNSDKATVTNSDEIIGFMLQVVPTGEPEAWLKKQQLIRNEKPTVCATLLFADEPQAVLPKRCGVKVYRFKTADAEGTRATLAFDPVTIEGPMIRQIQRSVQEATRVVEDARTIGEAGLEEIRYPHEAIHEIVCNAVIHRDYSIADDIHIRVFDNRVEVESPGRLPAHITPANILDERFARNGNLVRLINKYPSAPNKDIGEGLNTAFSAMRTLGLKDPIIQNKDNSVLVVIRHERLASHEQLILEHLESHESIQNKEARDLCHVDGDYRIRTIFGRLERLQLIERVPGTKRGLTAYRKGANFSAWRTRLPRQAGAGTKAS